MHFIIGTYNISIGFRPSGGAFYSSIGWIGTISTNGKTFIPLMKCISFQGLRIFLLASGWVGGAFYSSIGTINWCQWNNIYSIGIPLVKCISLWGLIIRPSGAALYLSIGTISTIGTKGITFIPLGFHWWNAYSPWTQGRKCWHDQRFTVQMRVFEMQRVLQSCKRKPWNTRPLLAWSAKSAPTHASII